MVSTQIAELAKDAQIAVLGSMLIEPNCVGEVFQRLEDWEFLEPTYRLVYQAFKKLYNAGRPIDALSVNDALGGGPFRQLLTDCVALTPTAANVEEWVNLLKARALQFRLAELGGRLMNTDELEEALEIVDEINAAGCQKSGVKITTMTQALEDFLDRHGEEAPPPYLTWGLSFLDQNIHIEEGDMVVLGGYPSAGKTALALQLCRRMSRERRVGYFYLENNDRKLFDRLVSSTAGISFRRIKERRLEEDDFRAIEQAQPRLLEPRLELVAASGMDVSDIRAVALSQHYEVVVIDYLQKLQGGGGPHRNLTEFERVTVVSSALQEFGRQTGIVVLALSQLNRPDRKDGEPSAPTMASLRQSGQIEQDADAVLLVYRSDAVDQEPRSLKIAKNKEGEAGLIAELRFDGDQQTFYQPARDSLREPPQRPRQRPRQVDFWSGFEELPPDQAGHPFGEGG